jgi:hypothetical protein
VSATAVAITWFITAGGVVGTPLAVCSCEDGIIC